MLCLTRDGHNCWSAWKRRQKEGDAEKLDRIAGSEEGCSSVQVTDGVAEKVAEADHDAESHDLHTVVLQGNCMISVKV